LGWVLLLADCLIEDTCEFVAEASLTLGLILIIFNTDSRYLMATSIVLHAIACKSGSNQPSSIAMLTSVQYSCSPCRTRTNIIK
jgi:hypothetical protein